MSSKISSIRSREILDSRGNPTVETTVTLKTGVSGVASVPSGASVGKYEAVELRDKDPKRYNGMGVLNAIGHISQTIAPKIVGLDALNQKAIDETMITLDATPQKSNLGANSILSVSLAAALAASNFQNSAPYIYFNALFSQRIKTPMTKMPTPLFNIINGGKHGAGNLDFQEFHIVPATSILYHDALELGEEIYQAVKQILTYRNAVHSVGDEGGFAPDLFTNIDALEVLSQAIKTTKYHFGVDVFFGLDVAASHFKKSEGYLIKDRPAAYSTKEFISYFQDLHAKFRLLLLEDPLEEDDWEGWKEITQKLGQDILIIGDDFLVTNPDRLKRAISQKSCSAILLKPNQIGTLTEFLSVVTLAKQNDMKCIVSHRSGETNDTTIADLAVAVQADYVKFGAPARGERVAKFNRLLQIEAELFSGK